MHPWFWKIENGLEGSHRKRRCVSADAEAFKSKQRRFVRDSQRIFTKEYVEDWLSDSGWSRQRASSKRISRLPSPLGTTSALIRKHNGTGTASSRSSLRSVASVHDTNYRETLEQYHIYVMEEQAPTELIERAEQIITRQRETPELEDATVKELKSTMRQLQNREEEDVKSTLCAVIVPDFKALPSDKLDGISGQPWTKAIAVPLDRNVLAEPLPLPKPKPDKAFGYAKSAFNASQLPIINLLAQNKENKSFVSPHEALRFPFLVIEFKSQAKDGSIRVARNQAAGAGAISMNGILELMSRASGLDDLDFDQPLFFSVTMDQDIATVNVHWVGRVSGEGQYTFHMEELRMLPLKYGDSIRDVQRAIKNILDYGADSRLQVILEALDRYREEFMMKRAAEPAELRQPSQQSPLSPPLPPSQEQSAPPRKKTRKTPARGKV